MSLADCKEYYAHYHPDPLYAPIGATEEEVQALEQRMGFTFPKEYREFLLWMGHDNAGVLREGRWFMEHIEPNTRYVATLLKHNGLPVPEGKYVGCYSYQGYVVAWFTMPNDQEDPLIYLYVEGDEKHPEPYVWGFFSDWVEITMEGTSLDIWKQFYARQEYEAGLAAKNGGLNPDGTVYTPQTPPWRIKAAEIREQVRQNLEAEAKAKADAEAQASAAQSSPAPSQST